MQDDPGSQVGQHMYIIHKWDIHVLCVYGFMNGRETGHGLVKLAQEAAMHLMAFLIDSLCIDFCLALVAQDFSQAYSWSALMCC